MGKRIVISVTSDLITDQRVHRTACALLKQGSEITLVGRKLKSSLSLDARPYKTYRFNLWFNSGPLFYAAYNIRLFLYLLFTPADVLIANDLDTLPANFLAARFKRIHLVFDSHEYYTGVPELENRPRVRSFWKRIEKLIFPQLTHIYTVNQSIADLYEKEYNKKAVVIRNIPDVSFAGNDGLNVRAQLNIDNEKKILILQGAGINIERGAEEAVEAMKHIHDAVLLIIGGGDVMPFLKETVLQHNLQNKIIFRDKMPFRELMAYTRAADTGLTLDKITSLNYRLSLPNKLFDYIHAHIAVLGSQVPEVKKIITEYNIGALIDDHNPEHIAGKIKYMLADEERLALWKRNAAQAAKELTWQQEEKKLIDLFHDLL